MDEEILDGPRLLQRSDRHRSRKDAPRPRPLRRGRFIPAALIRIHEEPALLWFPACSQYVERGELSA